MTIMCVREVPDTPRELIDYAYAQTAMGAAISILRMEDGEGYHFIATGADSDFYQLRDMGYSIVEIYAPQSEPLYDIPSVLNYSDERCC